MTWATAGVIAEVVAAIAVVVSLWYLAVQLKQSTELSTRLSTIVQIDPTILVEVNSQYPATLFTLIFNVNQLQSEIFRNRL